MKLELVDKERLAQGLVDKERQVLGRVDIRDVLM